ncbi:MAG: hypothetical protein ACRD3V_26880 [Vicinamibacteria bacterium]
MSATARKLILVALLGIEVAALSFYVLDEPSWTGLAMAFLLILIWTPVKGLLYRRLEGVRPYESALAANAASEIAGLPVHLGLSFWPLMGASFLVSAAIKTLALVVMGTAASLTRCLALAIYGSLVVHLLTAGWFASHRSLALGITFLVVGVVLFHLPSMK